jgi:gliding motility-associated-like protein
VVQQVFQPAQLSVSAAVVNVSCFGGSNGVLTFTPSGGTAPYSYDLGTGAQASNVFSNLVAGSFTVVVTDANLCTATVTATITEPLDLTINVAVTNTLCFGAADGQAVVTASGGTAPYLYNIGPGNQVSTLFTGLAAGNYIVTITDDNACTYTQAFTIAEPARLTATASSIGTSCFGGNDGSITLLPTGGTAPYTFQWSNFSIDQNPFNLVAGLYSVTITDDNGCTFTTFVNVAQPPALLAQINSTPISCQGGNDGTANVNPAGGTAGYTYLWSNGATTAGIAGLTAGTYTVTITDSRACTLTASTTLSQPPALVNATATLLDDVTCFGGNDGSAIVTAAGGTPGYTYTWPDGTATPQNDLLAAGLYTITVTDINGCQDTANVLVGQASQIVLSTISTHLTCHEAFDGAIEWSATGGTPGYLASLDSGLFTPDTLFQALDGGVYNLTIQDAEGCEVSTQVILSEPPPIVLNLTLDVSIELGNDTELQLSILSPIQGPVISWTPSSTLSCTDCLNPVANPVETTTYTALVTDINGCSASEQVTVTVEKVRDVFIPTIFTPNGDGNNDVFTLFAGPNVARIEEMLIFDRWGDLVYSGGPFPPSDINFGWDGTYNLKDMNTAVFVYYIRVSYIDGSELDFKGDVTLTR